MEQVQLALQRARDELSEAKEESNRSQLQHEQELQSAQQQIRQLESETKTLQETLAAVRQENTDAAQIALTSEIERIQTESQKRIAEVCIEYSKIAHSDHSLNKIYNLQRHRWQRSHKMNYMYTLLLVTSCSWSYAVARSNRNNCTNRS